MTLASILRAQLATGRPLRVTRALLEALDEPPAGSADYMCADLCRVLALPASSPVAAIVAAVVAIRERAIDWETKYEDASRELAHRPTMIAHTAACRERDEARDVVNRCATALRRHAPEMAVRGGPCLPGEVDHALASMAHFRDEARRERDEARRKAPPGMTARDAARQRFALDGADAQALEGAVTLTERERDEARAEVERLRSLAAPVDCARLVREAEERGARWALEAAEALVRASAGRRMERALQLAVASPGRARTEHGAEVAYTEAHSIGEMDAERICAEARKAGEHG